MRLQIIALLIIGGVSAYAGEADALAISANIQARHLPFGAVLDPMFASDTSNQITGYTRCGDSALWTGSYLAAEAFRYNATRSADALNNVKQAIAALKGLVDVTAINLLARCMFVADWPYAAGIRSEEAANGIYTAPPWNWVANTSRDQYSGAIFGLGVAYDMVDDAAIKNSISDLVTRLVRYLTGNNWSVVMPDGRSSTTFLVRPEEMLAFVQVGRHVNPGQFGTYYGELRVLIGDTGLLAPVAVDAASDDSYFKFNLDYINFYNLIRLENSSTRAIYEKAYGVIRNHTAGHLNAFFDIVDRGLMGPNADRDARIGTLLDQWLTRPRRDRYVDLHGSVPVCGLAACDPIPVALRPPTDFLWQRSPFQLMGGGAGTIENAGVDYILVYWMARYYGLLSPFTVQSAAASNATVAPESLVSLFGSGLSSGSGQAASLPLPTMLGGASLTVTDAGGTERLAPLIYVTPKQINFLVPAGTQAGTATFTITSTNTGGATPLIAKGDVQTVAPSLFSMNGAGTGVAAATAIRTQAADPRVQAPVQVFQCSTAGCVSTPIELGIDTPVYLAFYGTGIRNRTSLANVKVTIHGVNVPVLYAGAQPDYPGLDQVNVALTLDLRGSGETNVVLTVDGKVANTVTINVK